jgi:GT2 family glycosyltransferase
MSVHPAVSVVLLSFNRPNLLSQALEALLGQTQSISEILVVDNRSPRSGEVAEVVGRFPTVRLIANDTNLGFTGGMNVGLAHATGEYILVTEDDLILDPNCIEVLMGYVPAHPEVALAGGLMVNHTSGTLRCAGGELRLGTRYEKRVHGWDEEDCGQFPLPLEVTYLPGGFLLARRSDWQRWGGFHPSFYLYYEDDELCLRVVREGGQIVMIPQARVRHFEPDPGPCPGWLERIKIRNLLQLGLLHVPARRLPVFLARYAILPLLAGIRLEPRAWLHFRALLDLLGRLPWLLSERYRTGTRAVVPR